MRKPLIPYILILFAALAVLAENNAFGAQSWTPMDNGPVMAQAKGITPALYPDSDVVVVNGQTWIRYQEDGTYTQWFEQYVKVITEKGKRNYRNLTSSFSIPYNTTKFTLVEVIGEDGKIKKVDIPKNSREMVEQSQMRINIYNPNDKVLQVSIPELELGDIVHYIIEDVFVKARMAGTFNDFVDFEGTDPIKRVSYTVVSPRTKPLTRIKLKSEIPGTVTYKKIETKDEIVYQWVARDIPRAFEEPEMPPLYTQVQRLLVSTIPDWRTVSRWYWGISKPHLSRTTPEMRSTAEHLVSGIKDRDKKIEAIFRWVSQEVRYLGIVAETEAPGYEPHDVSMTFERRAGVCRDKAALLVAMLRLAHFDAYPVLIMSGPKKDPEVPQPYFNHAIVSIKKQDGKYMLMDPTDESTRELFPSYLNNMSYLVATPSGETLFTSPVIPSGQNMMHISTTGSLDGNGTLRADTTFLFDGINDNAFRGYFSRISNEEQRTYFEKILRTLIPGATLTSLAITPENILDISKKLQVKISFTSSNYIVKSKSVSLIPMFRFGDNVGVVNHLIQRMGLKERKYTYRSELTAGVEETLNIDLDPSLGKALNPTFKESTDDENTFWSRSITLSENKLIASNRFEMKLSEYTPEQYKHIQETLKKIEKANRIKLAFSQASSARTTGDPWYDVYRPEAVILDEKIDVDIADETAWTETRHMKIKVLTYSGKKRYGDLQIPFNPAWDEVDVTKVLETAPTGQIREIHKNEINVMDEKWVGSASRYPAGKIKVVSMPGLQEGSVIDYTIVMKKKNRQCFFLNILFQSIDPIEAVKVSIHAPDGISLKMGKSDEGFGLPEAWRPFPDELISQNKTKEGNKTVYEFSAKQVPPIKKEENLPPAYCFNPAIFVTSGNLARYASEMMGVLEKAASSQPEANRKAQEIVRKASAGDRKILSIRDFVAKSIHDVDVDLSDLPLSTISPADKTLADGYGHSADKAVLLYAMCKAAGFSPEFVLTTDEPSVSAVKAPIADFPAPDWFDKVLVRVKTGNGYVYLGDTDQYAELGSTPMSGRPVLIVGSGKIDVIQAMSPEYENRINETISVDLSATGDATIHIRRSRYGMDHARFMKDYKEMTPEERRRRFQEIVSSISKAATPLGPYSISTDTYPGVEDFTVRVPAYAERQDDRLSLDLPGIVRAVGCVIGDERSNPLYRDVYTRRLEKVEVILPEGVKSIEMMPPQSVRYIIPGADCITLETKVVPASDGKGGNGRMRIEMEQSIDLKPFIALPDEYHKLLEIHRAISHPSVHLLLLKMEK